MNARSVMDNIQVDTGESSASVAISWWSPGHNPGGRSQAIRGNVRGFLEAGCDVDLWWFEDLVGESPSTFASYDLLVVPYIRQGFDVPCPVHLQIGGYGAKDLSNDQVSTAMDNADSVSFLDPRLALYFDDTFGISPAEYDARLIPNAPNHDLFDPQPDDATTGHVMVPKVGGPYKSPQLLNTIAAGSNEIPYYVFAGVNPPRVETNVTFRPAVPFTDMERYYAAADLVVNPSEREGLPNVAWETFMCRRPYVSTPRGIGLLQTLPEDVLDVDEFGAEVDWFIDEHHRDFHEGDHFITASASHLSHTVKRLMFDRDEREQLADRGRSWVEAVDYTWEDKAKLILEEVGL